MPYIQFQMRRDTAASWATINPILASGEFGYESDTSKFKIGNGATGWNYIDYAGNQGGGVSGTGSTGATGATGDTGSTGATGATGATGQTGASGEKGDPGVSDRYKTTSVTSFTLDNSSNTSKTFLVESGLSWTVGMACVIAYDVNNSANTTVVSYSGVTGQLNVFVNNYTGSGQYTSWAINVGGVVAPKGDTGATGVTGATGATGQTGATGIGIPAGGTAGQILSKVDGTNYNTQWIDNTGGGGGGGGTGIYANDTWMYTNMLSPPPFIKFTTVNSTSSQILIGWDYPTQFPMSLVNAWVPIINTLNVQFRGVLSNGTTLMVSTITNAAGSYINPHNGASYVTGVVLSKQSGSSGIQTITYPDTTVRSAYVYYDPTLATLSNTASNTLRAWYANINPSTNISTLSFSVFITAGAPSATRTLALSALAATTATFTYVAPQYVDSSDPTSLLTITGYTITYSSAASTVRYGAPLSESTRTVSNGVSLSYGATSLYPDSVYTFSVTATNSESVTGPSGTAATGTTSYLTPSAALSGSLSFSPTVYSNGTIKNILSGLTKSTLITSTTALTSGSFVTPIHTIALRGSSSGSTLMTLSATVVNNGVTTTGPSITFSGFPSAGSPGALTTNSITLTPTVSDKYAIPGGAQTGFYLQSANTLTIGSAIFAASQFDYVVTASQSGSFTGSATYTFQYDTPISTAPTITTPITFTLGTVTAIRVSGIYIVYGAPTFNAVVATTNMGRYYYSSPLLQYTNAVTGAWSPASETDLTAITAGLAAGAFTTGAVTFTRTLTSASLNSMYLNALTLSVIAGNTFANSSAVAAPSIPVLVDGPSYTLVYSTMAQTLPIISNAAGSVIGFRVTSGTAGAANVPPFNNGGTPYANTAYDNTLDITGTQELQVSNGKFTTPTGPGQTYAYQNYSSYRYSSSSFNTLNYSGISATGYRYATFAWRYASSPSNGYTTLAFRLYNTSGVTITNNLAYAGGSPIQLYFRIENAASSTPTNTGNMSSAWVNANSITPPVTSSGNYFQPSTYTDAPYSGLYGTAANISTYTNFPVLVPPMTINAETVNLYCRIGIPMNVNFSFSYITAVTTW